MAEKKRLGLVFLIFGIILVLSFSLVSANMFSDFLKKLFFPEITGQVTSGTCSGTATACSTFTTPSTCSAQKGCVFGSAAFSNSCGGTATSCPSLTSQASCQNQSGCMWTPTLTTPPPIIADFHANPSTINNGSTTVLSWSSANTIRCISTPGPGYPFFDTNGLTIGNTNPPAPTQTTTYSLTCYGSNNTPIIATTIVTVNPPGPKISISPTNISCNYTLIGQWSNCDGLTVSNTGGNTLTVFSIDLSPSAFWIFFNSPPFSLTPGSSLVVWIDFSPKTAATYKGTVTLQSNDPDSPTVKVPITGTGVEKLYEFAINVIPTAGGDVSIFAPGGDVGNTAKCDNPCTFYYYAYGTPLILTANPATGYKFSSWGGDASSCGTSSTCNITIGSNEMDVTANFVSSTAASCTCNLNGKCYSLGKIEKTNYYCTTDGEVYKQKQTSESCNDDFECLSGYCVSGVCSVNTSEEQPKIEAKELICHNYNPGGGGAYMPENRKMNCDGDWRTGGCSSVYNDCAAHSGVILTPDWKVSGTSDSLVNCINNAYNYCANASDSETCSKKQISTCENAAAVTKTTTSASQSNNAISRILEFFKKLFGSE